MCNEITTYLYKLSLDKGEMHTLGIHSGFYRTIVETMDLVRIKVLPKDSIPAKEHSMAWKGRLRKSALEGMESNKISH